MRMHSFIETHTHTNHKAHNRGKYCENGNMNIECGRMRAFGRVTILAVFIWWISTNEYSFFFHIVPLLIPMVTNGFVFLWNGNCVCVSYATKQERTKLTPKKIKLERILYKCDEKHPVQAIYNDLLRGRHDFSLIDIRAGLVVCNRNAINWV